MSRTEQEIVDVSRLLLQARDDTIADLRRQLDDAKGHSKQLLNDMAMIERQIMFGTFASEAALTIIRFRGRLPSRKAAEAAK